jgi:hypothetical protein
VDYCTYILVFKTQIRCIWMEYKLLIVLDSLTQTELTWATWSMCWDMTYIFLSILTASLDISLFADAREPSIRKPRKCTMTKIKWVISY